MAHYKHDVTTRKTTIIIPTIAVNTMPEAGDFPDLPDSEPLILVDQAFQISRLSPQLLSYLLKTAKVIESG